MTDEQIVRAMATMAVLIRNPADHFQREVEGYTLLIAHMAGVELTEAIPDFRDALRQTVPPSARTGDQSPLP
ncbi:hypothetical protein [Methylobacterium sp. JK268]